MTGDSPDRQPQARGDFSRMDSRRREPVVIWEWSDGRRAHVLRLPNGLSMTAVAQSLLANSRVEIAVVGQTISHHCKGCKGLLGGVDVRVPEPGRRVWWRELIEGEVGCGGDIGLLECLGQQGLRKFRFALI
jgi:hypothetical protein